MEGKVSLFVLFTALENGVMTVYPETMSQLLWITHRARWEQLSLELLSDKEIVPTFYPK